MTKYQKEKITLSIKIDVLRLNSTILLFLLVLVGCQSRDIRPKSTGTEYFPLKIGAFWVYNISETSITQLGGQTNSIYELKLQINDSILSSGQTAYVIERFRRTDSSLPWSPVDTWTARRGQFQAVVQEGNISYIKLSFPLAEEKKWDGNALNTLGGPDQCQDGTNHCDNYVVSNLAQRFQSTGISYENTVTVIESNVNDPIVNQDVRKSVYAKSIGLVYHEENILAYCTVGDCIGKQIVENGSILKQTMKAYGGL